MIQHSRLRRAYVALGGGLLVILGLVGLVLPIIPGLVLLIAGLILWSSEFGWAKRLLARIRRRLDYRINRRSSKKRSPKASPEKPGGTQGHFRVITGRRLSRSDDINRA